MDRGVKANAMWALHIVAPIGAMVGRATSQGAVTTGGVVKEVGWAEEEDKCEGGGIQVYLPMKPTGAAPPFLAWV